MSSERKRSRTKKRHSPYLYDGEVDHHRALLTVFPPPPPPPHTISDYDNQLVFASELPAAWRIVRPAERRETPMSESSFEELCGTKRTAGESNQDYAERNRGGLRASDFHVAVDDKGLDRWLLRLRDFPQLTTAAQRRVMQVNSNLELYIEKPGGWLAKICDFNARVHNWDASELFLAFFGLVPSLFLIHKIRSSSVAKKVFSEYKATKEEEEESSDDIDFGDPADAYDRLRAVIVRECSTDTFS